MVGREGVQDADNDAGWRLGCPTHPRPITARVRVTVRKFSLIDLRVMVIIKVKVRLGLSKPASHIIDCTSASETSIPYG